MHFGPDHDGPTSWNPNPSPSQIDLVIQINLSPLFLRIKYIKIESTEIHALDLSMTF